MRALLFGAALLCLGACGDDAPAPGEDAAVAPDLSTPTDAGPLCGCRGDRGTLIYDLACGEGLCDGPDLLQCVADGELTVGEGRCGGDDMGAGDGGL